MEIPRLMPGRPTAVPNKSMPVPRRPTKRPVPSCKPEPTDDVSNTYVSVVKEEEQEEIVEGVRTDPYFQLESIKLLPFHKRNGIRRNKK